VTTFQIRETADGVRLQLWCPGCESVHEVTRSWAWSFDADGVVTISPSVLVTQTFHESSGLPQRRCHSFVRAGRWEFLGDCTHELAGQTVPLPELPEWLLAEAAGGS
jgi:hypothetical protein